MNTRSIRWFILLMLSCGLLQVLQGQEPAAPADTTSIQQKVLDLLVNKLADALKDGETSTLPDSSTVEASTLPVAEGSNLNFSLDNPLVPESMEQEEEQQDPGDKKADKNKQKAKAGGKKPKSEMRQQKAAQNKPQQGNDRSPANKGQKNKKDQYRKKGG